MTNAATLLPPNATDLDRAAALVVANISDIPAPIRSVWNPYTCPEALLPWLAYAYAVDEWDDTWTPQVKRDVIAQSIQVKRYKGTYGAVQSAITAMGLQATVQEWYQQTPAADPYTFRLGIEAEQLGFNQQQLATIRNVAERYKNLRSHLAGVDIAIRSTDSLAMASIALTGTTATVSDGTPHYLDGTSALDLMIDGAVNGYDATGEAVDTVNAIVAAMPANLSIPTDL
ncbi:MAG: hypothetical protein GAK30_01578 [Paracidovorax wautersii]|uniref:Phage tail protein, P2 protein I family n=1 Tax=Paracidovorax wautersii TaxID=1177982 RepID=A0A7V8FPQ5_9BURK|nr:MAG: hypothetical protein GAK30_01578 [Paracidovorax wautersii]